MSPAQKHNDTVLLTTNTEFHLKKDWLIKDAVMCGLTKSKSYQEAEKEFTCFGCESLSQCRYAWDGYNLLGDCLAEK